MTDDEKYVRENLAIVFNLIKHFGWDDLIFTHASARIPGTDDMLINRYGIEFERVTPISLLKVDINSDDEVTHANIAGVNLHRTFYKNNPEVYGVIHTHTNEGIAVSIDKRGLLPISQQAMFVLPTLTYFDQYNGVIVNDEDPTLIVKEMGNNKCMILRNHGLLTAGTSVQEAFIYMYQLQKSCEIQAITNLDYATFIDTSKDQTLAEKYDLFKTDRSKDMLWEMLDRTAKRTRKS